MLLAAQQYSVRRVWDNLLSGYSAKTDSVERTHGLLNEDEGTEGGTIARGQTLHMDYAHGGAWRGRMARMAGTAWRGQTPHIPALHMDYAHGGSPMVGTDPAHSRPRTFPSRGDRPRTFHIWWGQTPHIPHILILRARGSMRAE